MIVINCNKTIPFWFWTKLVLLGQKNSIFLCPPVDPLIWKLNFIFVFSICLLFELVLSNVSALKRNNNFSNRAFRLLLTSMNYWNKFSYNLNPLFFLPSPNVLTFFNDTIFEFLWVSCLITMFSLFRLSILSWHPFYLSKTRLLLLLHIFAWVYLIYDIHSFSMLWYYRFTGFNSASHYNLKLFTFAAYWYFSPRKLWWVHFFNQITYKNVHQFLIFYWYQNSNT